MADKINYMELRLLVKEYHYYNGNYPFLKDIYKVYKEKFNYEESLRRFGFELHILQKEGHRMGFIEEEKEYSYKRKDRTKPNIVKRKIKRLIIR